MNAGLVAAWRILWKPLGGLLIAAHIIGLILSLVVDYPRPIEMYGRGVIWGAVGTMALAVGMLAAFTIFAWVEHFYAKWHAERERALRKHKEAPR